MKKVLYTLTFLFYLTFSFSQEDNHQFNYEAIRSEGKVKILIELVNPAAIKGINIIVINSRTVIDAKMALLSEKKDGNFYLYFNEKEIPINAKEIRIEFNDNYGVLNKASIKIELLNNEFQVLNSYKQVLR